MKYNRLGETGLMVSELSFGSWVTFSESGQVAETKLAYDIMKKAFDGGVNFFDNAEVYSNGEAEEIMGKAVRMGIENKAWGREDLVLSTKIFFGAVPKETGLKKPNRVNRIGLSRKHIIEGTKASLARMGLDYVDLVFCHRFDTTANMEEIVRAFNFLIDQGLCFYWGTSEWSAEQIREATGIAQRLNLIPPQFDQPQYHMFEREKVEIEYRRLYPNFGLTIWSPLASGVLTGKYKDGIPAGSRLDQESFKTGMYKAIRDSVMENAAKAEKIRPIAEKLGCSMAQLALAWCMANPNVSTVITGATSVEQVEENLAAIPVIDKLTPELMKEIDAAIDTTPKLPQPQIQAQARERYLRSAVHKL